MRTLLLTRNRTATKSGLTRRLETLFLGDCLLIWKSHFGPEYVALVIFLRVPLVLKLMHEENIANLSSGFPYQWDNDCFEDNRGASL